MHPTWPSGAEEGKLYKYWYSATSEHHSDKVLCIGVQHFWSLDQKQNLSSVALGIVDSSERSMVQTLVSPQQARNISRSIDLLTKTDVADGCNVALRWGELKLTINVVVTPTGNLYFPALEVNSRSLMLESDTGLSKLAGISSSLMSAADQCALFDPI